MQDHDPVGGNIKDFAVDGVLRRDDYELTGDAHHAVREAFLGTGRAMLITTLILVCAFTSDMVASLSNIVRFGFFIALTIVTTGVVTSSLGSRIWHFGKKWWVDDAPLSRNPKGARVILLHQ